MISMDERQMMVRALLKRPNTKILQTVGGMSPGLIAHYRLNAYPLCGKDEIRRKRTRHETSAIAFLYS